MYVCTVLRCAFVACKYRTVRLRDIAPVLDTAVRKTPSNKAHISRSCLSEAIIGLPAFNGLVWSDLQGGSSRVVSIFSPQRPVAYRNSCIPLISVQYNVANLVL